MSLRDDVPLRPGYDTPASALKPFRCGMGDAETNPAEMGFPPGGPPELLELAAAAHAAFAGVPVYTAERERFFRALGRALAAWRVLQAKHDEHERRAALAAAEDARVPYRGPPPE